MTMPDQYQFLLKEPGPKILKEALHLYGTIEYKGDKNNTVILNWAKEVGGWIGDFYNMDSIPWCGLYVAICAKRAGFPFNQKALSAREWIKWGKLSLYPQLADVLIFQRSGGGHVGFYVAEDENYFHVLGGNQSDSVNITRISKNRLVSARQCEWKIAKPSNIRPIILQAYGNVSHNEA